MPEKTKKTSQKSLEARIKILEEKIPETMLLDQSFFKRALAIYGHYFVINMIIGAVVGVIMAFTVILPIMLIAASEM